MGTFIGGATPGEARGQRSSTYLSSWFFSMGMVGWWAMHHPFWRGPFIRKGSGARVTFPTTQRWMNCNRGTRNPYGSDMWAGAAQGIPTGRSIWMVWNTTWRSGWPNQGVLHLCEWDFRAPYRGYCPRRTLRFAAHSRRFPMRDGIPNKISFFFLQLDNRGSARRGFQFEGAIKYKTGQVYIEDQEC